MTIHAAQRKLGELIIVLRKQCNLGVKALAQKSRVQKKHILQIQCGIGPFVEDTIKRILNVFQVEDLNILSRIKECMNVIWPVPRGPVFRSALI
jgi:transcriptional regulator with XRE-family HTH domain